MDARLAPAVSNARLGNSMLHIRRGAFASLDLQVSARTEKLECV
jgi:hypothetical protein